MRLDICGRSVEPVWIDGIEWVNTCRLGWVPRSAAQWYLRAWWADGEAWDAMHRTPSSFVRQLSALVMLAELLVVVLVFVCVARGLRRA